MPKTKTLSHYELPSIASNWHRTWDIFSGHFLKFIAVTVIPVLLFDLFYLISVSSTVFSINSLKNPTQLLNFGNGYVYFLIVLILAMAFVYILGLIALFVLIGNYQNYSISEIFKKSIDFFWSFIWMSIIIGFFNLLALIAGYIVVTALGVIFGWISRGFLEIAFDYLTAIPFLINVTVSIFMIFAPYLLIVKKMTAWKSVLTSFKLINGHFWVTLLRLFTAYVVVALIFIVLGFIPFLGYTIASLITIPFLAIFTFVIFNDIYQLKRGSLPT